MTATLSERTISVPPPNKRIQRGLVIKLKPTQNVLDHIANPNEMAIVCDLRERKSTYHLPEWLHEDEVDEIHLKEYEVYNPVDRKGNPIEED